MGILSDLMHTGINMGLGYGMNQLGGALRGSPSQATTMPDQGVPSSTNTDQAPALGSSGLNALDPLTRLALRNMGQSGIPGMMPAGGGQGILGSLLQTGIQALPMALSML